jgi:isochorismate synthase
VASAWIRRTEPFRRGLFTGALGYMDASGDGDFAVSIRCAEVAGQRVRIFAGAGIVADSDADAELGETEAKMATMLAAFGLLEPS